MQFSDLGVCAGVCGPIRPTHTPPNQSIATYFLGFFFYFHLLCDLRGFLCGRLRSVLSWGFLVNVGGNSIHVWGGWLEVLLKSIGSLLEMHLLNIKEIKKIKFGAMHFIYQINRLTTTKVHSTYLG